MEIIRKSEIKNIDRGGYIIKRLFTLGFDIMPKDVGFYETTVPVGGMCKEQWHNKSYEAVYFLSSGEAIIEGKSFKLEKGDLAIVYPGEKHAWCPIDEELLLFAMRFPHLIEDKFTND